jgi:hypothetical protein
MERDHHRRERQHAGCRNDGTPSQQPGDGFLGSHGSIFSADDAGGCPHALVHLKGWIVFRYQ